VARSSSTGVWGRRLIAALLVAFATDPLLAQSQLPTDVTDPARQATRRAGEIEAISREAEDQRLLRPEREVTYDDVLANPDNIDLNFAYAQVQIARGDLRSAAATLERMLLIEPDLPRVRLLYAIVLYRLDNLDEAERELQAVRLLEMPPSLRAELDRYLEQLRLRRQRTRYTLTASLNFQYDWNRNSAPASNQRLISDLPGNVTGHDLRKQDQSLNGLTRFDVSHDLGYQSRHKLNGALMYYRGEQIHLSELDLAVASGEFGGVYDANPVSIIPNFYSRRINLANQTYGHSEGVNLRAEHQLTGETQLYTFGEAEYQKYRGISTAQTAPERTGSQFTVGLGVNHVLDPTMRIGFEVTRIRKNAARNYNAYDGEAASLSHTWLFDGGLFLLSTLSGEIDHYDERDSLVSELNRRDRIARARTTLGIPVATLIDDEDGELPFLKNLTLSLSAEATRQVSNLTNFTYNNRRASIGLSKRWEF
jgi:hypothetical protein